jgi:hypothetical protein
MNRNLNNRQLRKNSWRQAPPIQKRVRSAIGLEGDWTGTAHLEGAWLQGGFWAFDLASKLGERQFASVAK